MGCSNITVMCCNERGVTSNIRIESGIMKIDKRNWFTSGNIYFYFFKLLEPKVKLQPQNDVNN